jgi:hypothetical protein
VKPLADYHRNRTMPDGRLKVCKPCRKKITAMERRDNEHVRAYERQRYLADPSRAHAWKRKYPERARVSANASQRVRNALATGRLTKPDVCEGCGMATRLEGAHWDYLQPLAVRWLCRPCHRRWDANEPKTTSW